MLRSYEVSGLVSIPSWCWSRACLLELRLLGRYYLGMARIDEAEARAFFARWLEGELVSSGMTVEEAGREIGRRPGWLGRHVRRREARDELTFNESTRLVELVGSDLDALAPEILGWLHAKKRRE